MRPKMMMTPVLALAGASLLLAACGSSGKTSIKAPTAAASPTTVAPPTTGSQASQASITVKAASIAGLGTVLVNGDGRTLYVLDSEKDGKITCTATGDCTKYWPAAALPAGTTRGIAGSGTQASLLGTAMSPAGYLQLTYAGWPLYTYSGDTRPGQATGQGFKDSFGVWWVLSATGSPIKTGASPATTTAPVPATRAPVAPAPTSPPTRSVPTTAKPAPVTSPPTSPPTTPAPTTTVPSSGGIGF